MKIYEHKLEYDISIFRVVEFFVQINLSKIIQFEMLLYNYIDIVKAAHGCINNRRETYRVIHNGGDFNDDL